MTTAYDYSRLQTLAQTLIQRFGRSITITVPGAKDASNPLTQPAAAGSSFSITGVFIDQSLRARQGVQLLNGAFLVASEDLPSGVDLSTAISVTDDGVSRKVQDAIEVEPGAASIIWEVQLGDRLR